jgi:hypothetical protein
MSSSHKNAGNEYLVHTDANVVKTDAWSLFGTSARVQELEEELERQKQALSQQKLQYTKLDSRYKQLRDHCAKTNETMENFKNELMCLKVHHYFLQKYVSEEQKQKMHKEKETTRETLSNFVELKFQRNLLEKDQKWMEFNSDFVELITEQLNEYQKTRHDDDDDKAIMTNAGWIKARM